jgi:hypothetical protein
MEEFAAGVLRSLGEGGHVSAGFAEDTKGTTAVKPWGSTSWFLSSRMHAIFDRRALSVQVPVIEYVDADVGAPRRRSGSMKGAKCALSAGRFAAAHAGMKTEHIGIYRGPVPTLAGPTERWNMDFVHDTGSVSLYRHTISLSA